MGYVGDRVVHDADAHLMEHPRFLLDHVDADLRDRLSPLWMRGLAGFAGEVIAVMDALRTNKGGDALFENIQFGVPR